MKKEVLLRSVEGIQPEIHRWGKVWSLSTSVEGIQPEIHRWGKVWSLSTEADGKEGSAGLLDMWDSNDPQYTKRATRYYFILEGCGEIRIGADTTYSIKKGSFLRVPPLTVHRLVPKEKLTVLVFSTPAYSEDDTVYQSAP